MTYDPGVLLVSTIIMVAIIAALWTLLYKVGESGALGPAVVPQQPATPVNQPPLINFQPPQNPANQQVNVPPPTPAQDLTDWEKADSKDLFGSSRNVGKTVRKVRLTVDDNALEHGGEASIHNTSDSTVVAKLFTDRSNNPALHKKRIADKLRMMRSLPKGLPQNLIVPISPLEDETTREPTGYTMKKVNGVTLSTFSDDPQKRLSVSEAVALLAKISHTVHELHRLGIVIGDFHPDNVMVEEDLFKGMQPYFIDVDSMHYNGHKPRTVKPEYAPMELLKFNYIDFEFELIGDLSEQSDWYSFAVIACKLLTFVHPYEGDAKGYTWNERFEKNISIFHQSVLRQPHERSLDYCPEKLRNYLYDIFVKKKRYGPTQDVFKI